MVINGQKEPKYLQPFTSIRPALQTDRVPVGNLFGNPVCKQDRNIYPYGRFKGGQARDLQAKMYRDYQQPKIVDRNPLLTIPIYLFFFFNYLFPWLLGFFSPNLLNL